MRILIAALSIVFAAGIAMAEESKTTKPGDAAASTGRTTVPTTQGIAQPQGPTGPINTQSGGAPAESPQGQTPPGMQSAPEGSDKTIVEEKKQ